MPNLNHDGSNSNPSSGNRTNLGDFVVYNVTDARLGRPASVAIPVESSSSADTDKGASFHKRTAIIAGTCSAAGLCLVAILLYLYLFRVRSRRRQRSDALLARWLNVDASGKCSSDPISTSKGRPMISKPEYHANDTAIMASKTRREIEAEKAEAKKNHLRSASNVSASSRNITSGRQTAVSIPMAKPEMVQVSYPRAPPTALKPRPKHALHKLEATNFASGVSVAPTFISTMAHPGEAEDSVTQTSHFSRDVQKPSPCTEHIPTSVANTHSSRHAQSVHDVSDDPHSTEEVDENAPRISLYPTSPSEAGKAFSLGPPPTLPTIDSRPVSFDVPLWQYDLFPADAAAKIKAASEATQSVAWK